MVHQFVNRPFFGNLLKNIQNSLKATELVQLKFYQSNKLQQFFGFFSHSFDAPPLVQNKHIHKELTVQNSATWMSQEVSKWLGNGV